MKRWLLCLRVEGRSVSYVDCLSVVNGLAICKPCSLLDVFVRCIRYDGILCHEFTQVCLHLGLHVSRCLSMLEVGCRVQRVPALFTRLLCSRVWYIFRCICRDELHRSLAPHGEEPGVSTLGVGGLSLGEVGGCAVRTCARGCGLHASVTRMFGSLAALGLLSTLLHSASCCFFNTNLMKFLF
jgi:hypothetical protein